MTSEIIVGLLGLAGSLIGTFFGTFSGVKLMSYRIEQLERKVEAHNQIVERTYHLEQRAELADEKIKVANHRLDDLEKRDNNA